MDFNKMAFQNGLPGGGQMAPDDPRRAQLGAIPSVNPNPPNPYGGNMLEMLLLKNPMLAKLMESRSNMKANVGNGKQQMMNALLNR